MKISIIIPAYNEERYIGRTLESLKQLTRSPDEIIVIDGGSTDKTAHVARSYGARVITIEHRGIGYARQKGLEAAAGDVVAFTDADTIVPKTWLSKICQSLERPNAVAVYSGYYVDGGWLPYRIFINIITPAILWVTSFIGPAMGGGQNIAFWRQKGLKAGGFPTDFKSVEDFEMLRRLKTVGEVIYRTDNYVTSSGRRGKEGFSMFFRVAKGFFVYFLTGKADHFDFPDIR